jgi:hypothetical protein
MTTSSVTAEGSGKTCRPPGRLQIGGKWSALAKHSVRVRFAALTGETGRAEHNGQLAVAAPACAYARTNVSSLDSGVVDMAAGRKPRAINQTASTISCTARGRNIKTCWDELAPITAYIASRSASA